jgi:hypothetical protein
MLKAAVDELTEKRTIIIGRELAQAILDSMILS